MKRNNIRRLTVSAVMLALATVLAVVCALIPFLNFPFGGGLTIASMLPIVLVSYMYGVKWGFFTSFTYAVIQILMDLSLGTSSSTLLALFMPQSEDYMGLAAAILILFIDYFVAYTVLGIGGIFRNRFESKTKALVLGAAAALSLRYAAHILSGCIFYGAWAEWFFSLEGIYDIIGETVLANFEGGWLSLVYSVCYNGCYMIPEIVITAMVAAVVSRLPIIKKQTLA